MNSNNDNGSINVTHEWKVITTITTTIETANKTPKWRQKLPICLIKWLAIKARTQSADWQHVCVCVGEQRQQSIGSPAERVSILTHTFALSYTLSFFRSRFWKYCCSYRYRCCCYCLLQLRLPLEAVGVFIFVSNFHWLMTVLHSIS